MKRVMVTYEAIVNDDQIKSESDVLAEGYDDLEDAIITDGIEGVVTGGYVYTIKWKIEDVEDVDELKVGGTNE